MRIRIIFIMSMAIALGGCQAPPDDAKEHNAAVEIQAMLDTQIADWNRGDVDAFMQSYWRDPEVRFASGGSIKRGWQTVLDNYRQRYPDKGAMGALTTRELEVTELSHDAAIAFGRWIVTAGGEDFCGLFTLVVRKIDGRWVIIQDHTSAADGPDEQGRNCTQIRDVT